MILLAIQAHGKKYKYADTAYYSYVICEHIYSVCLNNNINGIILYNPEPWYGLINNRRKNKIRWL